MVCSHISFNQIITNVDCGEIPTTACAEEADHYDGNDDYKDLCGVDFLIVLKFLQKENNKPRDSGSFIVALK